MLCMTALFFIKARFSMNDGAEKGQNLSHAKKILNTEIWEQLFFFPSRRTA